MLYTTTTTTTTTITITTTTNNNNIAVSTVTLNVVALEVCDNAEHLGVGLQNSLEDNADIYQH